MRWILGASALLISLLLGLAAWVVVSEPGLQWAVARLQAATDGKLAIDGLQGSLIRDLRFARLRYVDDATEVEVRNGAFRLQPWALLGGQVAIQQVKIDSVSAALGESADAEPSRPILPLGMRIDQAEIGQASLSRPGERYVLSQGRLLDVELVGSTLDLRIGELAVKSLSVERLEESYLADQVLLRSAAVTFRRKPSALPPEVRLGQGEIAGLRILHPPQDLLLSDIDARDVGIGEAGDISGSLSFGLQHASYPADVALKLGGTVERVELSAEGKVAGVPARASLAIAPFSEYPLRALVAETGPLDLRRIDPAWPRTDVTVKVAGEARRIGGLAGTVSARNAAPGPIDKERLPVAALAGRFSTDFTTLALSDLRMDLNPAGRLTGAGEVRPGRAEFAVQATALDLSAIRSTLQRTKLDGPLRLVFQPQAQAVEGTLSQAGMSISAELIRSGDVVEIRSLRAAAEGGEATGTGRVQIAGPMRFEGKLSLARFDPSRFGEYPSGDISGRIDAAGSLAPGLRAKLRWRIEDSMFQGEPLASVGEASVDGQRIAGANAEATLGSALFRARGDFGGAGDTLSWELKVPQVERFLDEFAGSLSASGRLAGTWTAPQGTVSAEADNLRLPNGMPLQRVAAKLAGSVERHTVDLSLEAEDVDLEARLAGGWRGEETGWIGEILALRNAGRYPMTLRAPAALRVAPTRLEVGELDAQLADGYLRLKGLTWIERQLASSGQFAGLPAQWAILAAGLSERMHSSMLVDGEWSLAAKPELTGTVRLRHAGGDLTLLGDPPLQLDLRHAVAEAQFKNGRLAASADLALAGGRVLLKRLNWDEGRLDSVGTFTGLPAQLLLVSAGLTEQLRSSLTLDGEWSLMATPRLTGTLRLRRAAGDLMVLGDAPIELGLQEAVVDAHFKDGHLAASADVTARHGSLALKGSVAPEAGAAGIAITPRSSVALEAHLAFAELHVLTQPFITEARLDGRVTADLRLKGTLERPQLDGSLRGEAITFDMPPYGIFLRGGELRAVLDGDVIRITDFAIQGGEGRFVATGTLPLHASNGGPRLSWRAERFGLMQRPDMRLVVSGSGQAHVADGRVGLSGTLRADRGYLELEVERLPTLGSDVVVVGETRAVPEAEARVPLALDLQLDLGDALQVRGYGLEGRLAGRLQLETTPKGELRAYGKIQTVNATFRAYGQRLQVDPGVAIFDGPLNNPALQMTAWRRNLQVEAGVQVTGTAAAPRVQLVSQPPVPEGERLSWLVLGRAPADATKADLGLLQTAAGALLARGDQAPLDRRIAQAFGLDEIALRGTGELADRVVAVGKRLSDRLYVSYEHGLGITATALVKLDFALTQRLALRAETGTTSGFGLFYRFSWD